MFLLPFREARLTSDASPDTVRDRLRGLVATGPFTGDVAARSFRIALAVGRRNSFAPVVSGQFGPVGDGQDGTALRCELRPTYPILAATLVVWLVAASGVGRALAPLADGLPLEWEQVAAPIGLLVFSYVLLMVGFLAGVREAKEELASALNAPSQSADAPKQPAAQQNAARRRLTTR